MRIHWEQWCCLPPGQDLAGAQAQPLLLRMTGDCWREPVLQQHHGFQLRGRLLRGRVHHRVARSGCSCKLGTAMSCCGLPGSEAGRTQHTNQCSQGGTWQGRCRRRSCCPPAVGADRFKVHRSRSRSRGDKQLLEDASPNGQTKTAECTMRVQFLNSSLTCCKHVKHDGPADVAVRRMHG